MINIEGKIITDLLLVWGPLALGWVVAIIEAFFLYKLIMRILDMPNKLAAAINRLADQHEEDKNA